MEPDELDSPSAEESAAAEQAAEDAFAASFQDNGDSPLQVAKDTEDKPASAKKAAPDKPAVKDKSAATPPAVDPPADPYAGLPDAVRAQLADIPTLRHDLSSMNGRYAAMQRELEALKTAKAAPAKEPPAPPPKPAKREKLRVDLPEVAEALDELDELATARAPKPKDEPESKPVAAPATDANALELQVLEEVHPDWSPKLNSTEFALWLGQQDKAYQSKVQSTNKAAVITDALTRFNVHMDTARSQATARDAEKQRVEAERKTRATASATPARGSGRPARAPPTDAETAAEEAFLSVFKD